MSLSIATYVGDEILPYIESLAALRIAVFGEFPYLYDGTMEYERNYLQTFASSPHSYLVVARAGDLVVGASTALPLSDADHTLQAPFREAGREPDDDYYFGESVLLPEYRGRRVGREFFEQREAQASFLAYPNCCFCAVVRPANHPLRPSNYRSHEDSWKRRGYLSEKGLVASMLWKDLGDDEETPKQMQFWARTTREVW